MEDVGTKDSLEKRITKQLFVLSEISEKLTLRLLQLEEKFDAYNDTQEGYAKHNSLTEDNLLKESEAKVKELRALLANESLNQQVSPEEEVAIEAANQEINQVNSHEDELSENNLLELTEDNTHDNLIEDVQYIDDPQMPLVS